MSQDWGASYLSEVADVITFSPGQSGNNVNKGERETASDMDNDVMSLFIIILFVSDIAVGQS